MDAMPTLGQLIEEIEGNQIDLMVLKESLALLISRLIASGVVSADFLGDMSVCAEGLHSGRGSAIISSAPPELRQELETLQSEAQTVREVFFTFIERLILAFRR